MPEVWYMKQLRDYERKIKGQSREIEELKRKLEESEQKRKAAEEELKNFALRKEAKKPGFPDYSLSKQEKLLDVTGKFISPGRTPKSEKLIAVNREEHVYPEDISPETCTLAYRRFVTHLREGGKEVVLYHIYKKKWSSGKGIKEQAGKIPQVMPRGEYGVEVGVILAFLIYTIGLSHAQTKAILSFFCDLEMADSQINSLLDQVSTLWEKDFERLGELILLAMVVYIDETGWKEGLKNCYTWLFKSISHTVLLYGRKRDEAVLDSILPRGAFEGIGVSDCYKIYEKRFTQGQKCWAHFLRKIIKLMLLHPYKKEYKMFFEALYKLFKEGKELKQEVKMTLEEKGREVILLKEQIEKLCTLKDQKLNKETPKDEREYVNLQKNLVRNLNDLFTFVLHEGVEPTNNKAEQALRFTAKARNNYQTSKTGKGSKRRSVLASILASLKQNLPEFSLKTVTREIIRWQEEGKSLFQRQLEELKMQGASP